MQLHLNNNPSNNIFFTIFPVLYYNLELTIYFVPTMNTKQILQSLLEQQILVLNGIIG